MGLILRDFGGGGKEAALKSTASAFLVVRGEMSKQADQVEQATTGCLRASAQSLVGIILKKNQPQNVGKRPQPVRSIQLFNNSLYIKSIAVILRD